MKSSAYNYMYVAVAPHAQIPLHSHDEWEISTVLYGRGRRTLGSSTTAFSLEEVVLVGPKMPHCWEFDSSCVDREGHIVNITIQFPTSFLQGLALAFPELEVEVLLSDPDSRIFVGEAADEMRSLMIKMRTSSQEKRVGMLSRIIMLAATGDSHRTSWHEPNADQQRIQSLEAWMACNFVRRVRVDEAAAHVGMSRSSFCTWHKRATSLTFITALNQYRLQRVAALLSSHTSPVSEIAWTCGFQSIPHFNHLFRRQYGCSPEAYRASHFGTSSKTTTSE
ncbi:MAG: AraC family transcriptional regulator [Bacteroidales bacterium]|nr:AraC family transcriptional regulator [Bacteroidales bacterium]